jgi:hypothetical protein
MKIMDITEALSQKDPDVEYTKFMQFFIENRHRLQEACRELGVEPPEEGPGLFKRLQEVLIPVFEKEAKDALGNKGVMCTQEG